MHIRTRSIRTRAWYAVKRNKATHIMSNKNLVTLKELHNHIQTEDSTIGCFYCGTRIDTNAIRHEVEYDHYISKANGGTDDEDNIVAACVFCNQEKGSMNGDEFIKKIKAERV